MEIENAQIQVTKKVLQWSKCFENPKMKCIICHDFGHTRFDCAQMNYSSLLEPKTIPFDMDNFSFEETRIKTEPKYEIYGNHDDFKVKLEDININGTYVCSDQT